ncbi:MAG: hypothetical protein ABIT20_17195 [Gemmatimonadaceae bacterium]
MLDRTVLGVPQFAFNGYSSVLRGDTTLARVAYPQLRSLNRERLPITPCLAAERHWRTIPDSVLIPMFHAIDGWTSFREQYGASAQFAMISQPLIAGDTATLVVATASGHLSGRGVVLQFVRDTNGHWVKRAEVQIWTS